MVFVKHWKILILPIFLFIVQSQAAYPAEQPDTTSLQHPEILMGSSAFADRVVLYDPGAMGRNTGDEPAADHQNPQMACGPLTPKIPGQYNYVSLGLGGTIVLEFTDNLLIDGPGPDLVIFQGNGLTDTLKVWLSRDGKYYYPAGQYCEKITQIDIHSLRFSKNGFTHVKIRDLTRRQADDPALGVDIDAAAALHTARSMIIPANQLFAPKQAVFKENSQAKRDSIAAIISAWPKAEIRIEVFSDQHGAEDFNQFLTQQQAGKLQADFRQRLNLTDFQYSVQGWGSKKPVDDFYMPSGIQGARIEFYIYYPSSTTMP